MSRPIPANFLIHSATLYNVVKDDYGLAQDNYVASLVHVRFEPSTRIIADANGTDIQCSAMMFFDAVNSYPQNVSFGVGQAILWEGERYIVQDIQRLYDEAKLHHLEVELSDG